MPYASLFCHNDVFCTVVVALVSLPVATPHSGTFTNDGFDNCSAAVRIRCPDVDIPARGTEAQPTAQFLSSWPGNVPALVQRAYEAAGAPLRVETGVVLYRSLPAHRAMWVAPQPWVFGAAPGVCAPEGVTRQRLDMAFTGVSGLSSRDAPDRFCTSDLSYVRARWACVDKCVRVHTVFPCTRVWCCVVSCSVCGQTNGMYNQAHHALAATERDTPLSFVSLIRWKSRLCLSLHIIPQAAVRMRDVGACFRHVCCANPCIL